MILHSRAIDLAFHRNWDNLKLTSVFDMLWCMCYIYYCRVCMCDYVHVCVRVRVPVCACVCAAILPSLGEGC